MDCERLKKKRKILEKDINIYPDLDNIKGPVVMADFPTHSAPQMKIDKGKISNEKGYRLAKSSHGVWEGSWYFEVLLENSVNNLGHVRIGWSQISGDLQAPCGYDAFSYSWRDAPGTLFHQSCAVKDAPGGYAGGYKPGDVIGVYIHLPPLTDLNRLELQKRLWNPLVDKEYVQIRSRPLQHVRNSEIRYFKNGVDMGVAFSPIYFGSFFME
jgi:hypothetical protein